MNLLLSTGQAVVSGALPLAMLLALAAGLVAFASPCVLPLVPGYLALLSSNSGQTKGRMLGAVGLFITGFTAVFVLFGVLAGALGFALAPHLDMVTRVLGVVVVVLGIGFLGYIPFLSQEKRLNLKPRAGLWGAPLLGLTFGVGWIPCIGPTLAAVLTLALDQSSAGRGGVLAVIYCIGLGLPFLLIALGLERSKRAMAFARRHRVVIMRLGGALMILLGIALVSGVWGTFAAWLQGVFTGGAPVVPVI